MENNRSLGFVVSCTLHNNLYEGKSVSYTHLVGYIEENDMDGLKKYYDMEIFPISNLFNKEKDVVAKLHNLDIICLLYTSRCV